MRKHLSLLFLLFIVLALNAQEIRIIPAPCSMELRNGSFLLQNGLKLFSDNRYLGEVFFLQKELLRYHGITSIITSHPDSADVILEVKNDKVFLYHLDVQPGKIRITSGSTDGAFYGIISLLQLVNASVEKQLKIPCLIIKDAPKMEWRGLMLDESRHFFGKEKVKSILDWMAYYKLNKFHWHLTDEPGWRIEIRKYPKLTLIGGIGTFTNSLAPAQYYTQADINEIVAYAQARKIEIIPEIDMPGHASAANRAYPEYSGGGSEKHPDFTFHPAKDDTYGYLTGILKEVNVLFPGRMLHLGGDEVSFGIDKWKTDEAVQLLMQQKGMKDIREVELYFIQRMADSLALMNTKILLWDEMVAANLPVDQTVIFWWRHDKPEQLQQSLEKGYKTVVCPRIPFYFDFVQKDSHVSGRKWAGKFCDLQTVYNFDLGQLPVEKKKAASIIGMQANIWTETIQTPQRLDFMTFPRMAALSEAAWTREENKNYDSFLQSLKLHLDLYKRQNVYYFDPISPERHPEPIF